MAGNCGNDLGEKLLLNFENIGDVTFSVGPEKEEIKSAVFLLRTLSPVFDKMFNENWNSQSSKVELPDIQPQVFRHFLKLLLTSKLTIESFDNLKLKIEEILHMLYIANKYDVDSIQKVCRDSISKRIEIGNAVVIYETVEKMNEPELEEESFDFITENIEEIVEDESFTEMSRESLCKILKCQDVEIDELELFNQVYRWAEFQCEDAGMESNGKNIRSVLGEILFLLRFPVMSLESLFEVVRPKGILTSKEVAGICHSIALKRKPGFINKCSFSVEDRGESTKEERDHQQYAQCVKFCPKSRISVSKVTLQSIDQLADPIYFVEFCISGTNLDDVCFETDQITSGASLNNGKDIDIAPSVILEKDNVYFFQFGVQFQEKWTELNGTMSYESGLKLNHITFEALP